MSPLVSPPATAPRPRGLHTLGVVLVLGVALSLAAYSHGLAGWYAPATLALAHLAAAGVALVVARRATRGARASGADPAGLIRTPRLYDWLVRVVTLGREDALRQRTLREADLQPGEAVLDVG